MYFTLDSVSYNSQLLHPTGIGRNSVNMGTKDPSGMLDRARLLFATGFYVLVPISVLRSNLLTPLPIVNPLQISERILEGCVFVSKSIINPKGPFQTVYEIEGQYEVQTGSWSDFRENVQTISGGMMVNRPRGEKAIYKLHVRGESGPALSPTKVQRNKKYSR